MARRRRKSRRSVNYQMGGMLSNLFSGGNGNALLEGITSSLQAFNNEPAMQGILGQSNSLFNNFQASAQGAGQDIDADKFKGLFDLASLFSTSSFGSSIFDDGGVVTKGKKLKQEFGSRMNHINESIIEADYMMKKQSVKEGFNQQYGDQPSKVKNIIPGTTAYTGNQVPKAAFTARKGGHYQQGGIPISPQGQFEFPGQPVGVPTPDGTITMDGVSQPLLAIDQLGNQAVLPPNSGMHQFAPGMVMEIPLTDFEDFSEPRPRRSRRKARRRNARKLSDMDSIRKIPRSRRDAKLSRKLAKRTVVNFNKRNRIGIDQDKYGNVGLPFARKNYK